jgi:gamma-tubulin complex component 3
MVHFVHQMQYYILFEVLECSWDVLIKQVQQAEALDDIISAHLNFLLTVKAGALLDDNSQVCNFHNICIAYINKAVTATIIIVIHMRAIGHSLQ